MEIPRVWFEKNFEIEPSLKMGSVFWCIVKVKCFFTLMAFGCGHHSSVEVLKEVPILKLILNSQRYFW